MQDVEADHPSSRLQPADDLELPTAGEEKRKTEEEGGPPSKLSRIELQPEDEGMNLMANGQGENAGNYAHAAAASSAPAVHSLPCDKRPLTLECCSALPAQREWHGM